MMSSSVPISDILPYTQIISSGGQTVYSTNWTANYTTDVEVFYTPSGSPPDDATQLLNSSQYSVAFIGGSQTVQVTLVTPANSGDIVTITRNTPASRTNLYSNTNFTPSMLNNDFGILTLVDQQAQLVNQAIGPRYNYSAQINNNTMYPTRDTILPLLLANQTWVMNSSQTAIIPLDVPSSGFAPQGATYLTLTDETSLLPNSQPLSLSPAGLIINNPSGSDVLTTTVTGTSTQITITNGNGLGGDINVAISPNPIMPGTAGMGIPIGTTAQRVTPGSNIGLRYNTDEEALEYFDGTIWVQVQGLIFPVPIADGGTGVTSVTTAPTATAFAGWDANKNLSAVGFIPGYATTATAGATTTLTVGSPQQQFFTGSSNQTLVMPVASTLVEGQYWSIVNNSSGTVTIESSGANTILALGPSSETVVTCILNSGTSAASWTTSPAVSGSGTVSAGLINQLAWYAANGNTVSGLTIVNSAGLLTNGSGVPGWVAYTGTGAPVLANTPTLITPVLGAATGTSLNFGASATNGLIGVTGGTSAAAGVVGEVLKVTIGSPVSLTTDTFANAATLSLTAGDWDVWGLIAFVTGGTVTRFFSSISLTSATEGTYPNRIAAGAGTLFSNTNLPAITTPISVSSTTSVYAVALATFATSTCTALGTIIARRRR